MSCNEIAGGGRLRSAGLTGERQNLTSDVSAQEDAARFGRLVTENALPAVASAAR